MKIALFSDTYIPDINGVATSTNILRNKLVDLGHDVLVVTSELPSDTTYDESLDDQVLRVPGLEIQALYGYRACNIFSFIFHFARYFHLYLISTLMLHQHIM